MKHEAYKAGDYYKVKCSNNYEDGTHTHITYWDIEHNESLRKTMNDVSIGQGGRSNISDFMFGKIDMTIKISDVWKYKENEEEGIVKRYNYYGEFINEEKTPKNGKMETYHDNGELNHVLPFQNGLKHGTEARYDEDGRKSWERGWYEGYRDGYSKSYYKEKKIIEEEWKKGELISSWTDTDGFENVEKVLLDV